MDRARVRDALARAAASDARRARFDDCGRHAWLYQKAGSPGEVKVAADTCRDRFCVPCTRDAAARVTRRLTAFLVGRQPRFITLTLKSADQPLAEQLTHLWRSFRRLRNQQVWRAAVDGGAAFFEVTANDTTGLWHPHLHVMVQGHFFDKHALSAAWKLASRGSFVVDVRIVKDPAKTTRYVAAYATKGYAAKLLRNPEKLPELIAALHGRRLCMTFGAWRELSLNDPEAEEAWQPVMPFSELQQLNDAGDPWAIAMMHHLQDREHNPCPIRSDFHDPTADADTASTANPKRKDPQSFLFPGDGNHRPAWHCFDPES